MTGWVEAYYAWRARAIRDVSYLRARACHCPPREPHYLHSEGLREGCDYVVDYGSNVRHPRRRPIPLSALGPLVAQIEPGSVVYVKADRLEHFRLHLRAPIVLVTGDSDYAPVSDHRDLLEDDRLLHWFAQNADLEHPKLTPIPIGLDNPRYTKRSKQLGFVLAALLGRGPLTLSRNEIGDQDLLRSTPTRPFASKPARAMATFHLNQKLIRPDFERLPDRRAAYLALEESPACTFFPRRLPQKACWEAHADFAFALSPQGNGMDCFRTWEALLLETAPIVRTSPLDPLYRQFPVVVVEHWSEVTRENLRRWQDELAPAFTPELKARLTCQAWLRRIRSR